MAEQQPVSNRARIVQLNISPGGVPKLPVEVANITRKGIEGDLHAYLHHGGPDRALCLFAIELIRRLAAEGHRIAPGSMGENVTVEGLEWNAIEPGRRLRLGERVVIEITRYTSPCAKITQCFRDGDHSRVSQKRHPGSSRVYARVLTEGVVRPNDPVRLLPDDAGSPLAGS